MRNTDLIRYELRLTDHAFERYEMRVAPIDREKLLDWCKKMFKERYRYYKKLRLIEIGGIWWGYSIEPNKRLVLTTCYGKSNVNFIRTIKWQISQNDRVNLKDLERFL